MKTTDWSLERSLLVNATSKGSMIDTTRIQEMDSVTKPFLGQAYPVAPPQAA
jgi:hypothetical protein